MPTFQVVSRTASVPVPPKKKPRRISQKWSAVIRVVRGMGISALLFVAILDISGGSSYTFVLLPAFLSLFIAGSWRYNWRNSLNVFINGTPLYILFTFCFALIYYSFITAFELLTHFATNTAHIILVTTTLAWAIILEPAHIYIQSHIERRFNVRDQEMRKAIEEFTSSLREEIDLNRLCDRFLTVIQQTMQPYTVSLWTQTSDEQQQQSSSMELIKVADVDPLIAYVLSHSSTLEIDRLQLDSPILQEMKLHEAEIILPFVSQGELLGLLILGQHLKGEAYSREEFSILDTLAPQVAPALRVAQMVQAQQAQVSEHERIEQELRTAQEIQHTFLPKDVPAIPGWQLVPYYQSAREVGGDFYDFLPFADGRLGLVIGDVSGKGIPAALVMTATRTMLRTAAQEIASPGEVFARANELLYAEIPSKMFVTCFYAVLDPTSGLMRYANAGHDLPYRRCNEGVSELRATGMPLGLMPGSLYEEQQVTIASGESLFFYTDGLVEAHNPNREMFGFPRLKTLLSEHSDGSSLFNLLLSELKNFTGEAWEQEDDITMVTLQRTVL
jgi:serine phosphatase RsbU (regulator of sigma subunit)